MRGSALSVEMILLRITAPHFCAGIVLDDAGHVIRAAPILAWIRGRKIDAITAYAKRKGWLIEQISVP